MKKETIIVLCLAAIGLASCASGPSDESESSADPISADAYVSSVSETAPILIAGDYEGTAVDYVVSSYPVIYNASLRNSKLSVYADVAEEFSKAYGTEGFPQAGLFIKKSLAEDESQKEGINGFLADFDADVDDLIAGGAQAIKYMSAYSEDLSEQASRFGFNQNILKGSQEKNGLSFIANGDNPTLEGFAKFKDPLGIDVTNDQLSSFYGVDFSAQSYRSDKAFSVTCPQGAPAAALARYASSDELTLTQPANVSAAFTKGEEDFIVFDSVNGLKLSAKNGGNYLLARMVTFGNLYVVSTGNDEDGVLSNDDYIVSYGEGLVPDLAFKAVYGD